VPLPLSTGRIWSVTDAGAVAIAADCATVGCAAAVGAAAIAAAAAPATNSGVMTFNPILRTTLPGWISLVLLPSRVARQSTDFVTADTRSRFPASWTCALPGSM
jgi:hypothetical protein